MTIDRMRCDPDPRCIWIRIAICRCRTAIITTPSRSSGIDLAVQATARFDQFNDAYSRAATALDIQRLDPGSDARLHAAFEFIGKVDAGRLEAALQRTMARHEALRRVVTTRAGAPAFEQVAPAAFRLDMRDTPAGVIAQIVCEETARPLPTEELPLRAVLVRLGPTMHCWWLRSTQSRPIEHFSRRSCGSYRALRAARWIAAGRTARFGAAVQSGRHRMVALDARRPTRAPSRCRQITPDCRSRGRVAK